MDKNPDPEGWVTLQVQFDSKEEACFVVMGLGARADVLEPATLRAKVAKDLPAALKRAKS